MVHEPLDQALGEQQIAHPEARQLVVPDNVAPVPGSRVSNDTGRESGLVQRLPASTVRHGVSFAEGIRFRAGG